MVGDGGVDVSCEGWSHIEVELVAGLCVAVVGWGCVYVDVAAVEFAEHIAVGFAVPEAAVWFVEYGVFCAFGGVVGAELL